MQNVLFVVVGKYRKEIAEKLAFLCIDCEDDTDIYQVEMCRDYLESAMKNRASEIAVSVGKYTKYPASRFDWLAEDYGYEVIEIKTREEEQ